MDTPAGLTFDGADDTGIYAGKDFVLREDGKGGTVMYKPVRVVVDGKVINGSHNEDLWHCLSCTLILREENEALRTHALWHGETDGPPFPIPLGPFEFSGGS